ncbi:hypothetical protein [Halorubrum sp. SY-15]|uniref:hypothetical protein n=1 Tax=Halorubrum sp. SY-15 TaxID=3402277 RepID=UPI003EC137AA
MPDLHSKIKEGDYSIEIKETRVGRLVTLSKGGERTLTEAEHDQLSTLIDEYNELIKDLFEAYEEHEDDELERAWAMGKLYKEEVKESEERTFSTLNPLLPFTSEHNRNEYLYRRFYEMFPDKNYEENHNLSMMTELAQRANPEQAREVYDETLRDSDEGMTKAEVRAAWNDEDPFELTIEAAVERAYEEMSNPSVENIEHIYLLRGVSGPPSSEKIQTALDGYE